MSGTEVRFVYGGSVRAGAGVASASAGSDWPLSVGGSTEIAVSGAHVGSDSFELSLAPVFSVAGTTTSSGTRATGGVGLELAIAPRLSETGIPVVGRIGGGVSLGHGYVAPRVSARLEIPMIATGDITTGAALSLGYEYDDGAHIGSVGLRVGFDLGVLGELSLR